MRSTDSFTVGQRKLNRGSVILLLYRNRRFAEVGGLVFVRLGNRYSRVLRDFLYLGEVQLQVNSLFILLTPPNEAIENNAPFNTGGVYV